tara:strand:- start:122 stop:442 length:321 start_codon:yes stop_codon:yes gene_type:complete
MKQMQIVELTAKLNSAGFKANIWKGFRTYLNGYGRDIKAYFDFDDCDSRDWENLLDGVVLKVFSNANQSTAWKVNRSKDVKFQIMNELKRAGFVADVCESAEEVLI